MTILQCAQNPAGLA